MEKLNSMDNTVLQLIDDDMRPVYQTMLDMNCGLQVVCVEIMPWKEYESEEAIIWHLGENSYENKRGILFVKGSEINDIVEILKRNISNIENAVTIIDSTKTTFSPTLSREWVLNLYKALIDICDDLKIKCPMLMFANSIHLKNKRGEHMAMFDENGEHREDVVWVREQSYYRMMATLAHELRHMYQQRHNKNYFKEYISAEDDMFAYTYSKEEIDAEAYAALVVGKMTGKDGLQYVFDNIIEYNNPEWILLKFNIRMRMNEIRNQEGSYAKQSITA